MKNRWEIKRANGGTLSCRTKRGRTMSAVPQAPFGSRSGQAFSKKARRAAPQLFGQMLKDKTRVLLPGESGAPAEVSIEDRRAWAIVCVHTPTATGHDREYAGIC